jgi:hypothetical protein
LLVLLLIGTARPGLAASPPIGSVLSPSAGEVIPRAYLPLLSSSSSQVPGSVALIDQAIARGELSAEQGLIYKVFAAFSDARLPAKYVGSGMGRDGDGVMDQVLAQASTLSDSAKQTLAPFFVPPNDPRSWYYQPHMGTATVQPQAALADWVPVSAAGGKIRIFYYSTVAGDAAKAATLAAEFNAHIWPTLTGLMQKTPLPNSAGTTDIYLWGSYIRSNGTIVAFDAKTLGITVPANCDQSAVTIYLPDNLPIGSANSPGLIQYATHEFMHAIQFAYTIQSCGNYRWLKEATATWAEDKVYPNANSEHEAAPDYLNQPTARLDNFSGMHPYGAYLLFYYLTHQVDTSGAVIRDVWQNAATTGNSYQAVDDAVNQVSAQWHDLYWPMYLATLWNKDPFNKYYAPDGLTATVAMAGGASAKIATPAGEQITPLYAQIPTGGALFYDLKFPDTSVRSFTILNGLGYNLHSGAANTAYSVTGDETYLTDDLSAADLQGINVALLMKASGQNAYNVPYILSSDVSNSTGGGMDHFDHCVDAQGAFDEVVVVLSNSDWSHPDRIMKPAGLPVTVFANNVPCYQVTGTFTAVSNPPVSNETGVTATANGTVTFGVPSGSPLPTAYQPWYYGLFPEISLQQLSMQAHWRISGTDPTGCTWSGEGDWTGTEATYGELDIEQGLLPGSPTYRGYNAEATPDNGDNSVDTTCPSSHYTQYVSFDALRAELTDVADCGHIRVDSLGNLSGTCTMPYSDGGYEQDTWNLHGVKK